jgi:hypothetical protein
VALVGLDGRIVEVEADIGAGLPRTVLVGLADTALSEARERCKAAVGNSGHAWPASLLTINLSPATLPKTGSHYDLARVTPCWHRPIRAHCLRVGLADCTFGSPRYRVEGASHVTSENKEIVCRYFEEG